MATCPHCSRSFPGDRVNSRHIAVCNPAGSPPVEPCACGHISTSLTQMKRHKRECPVWQARDPDVAEAEKRAKMKATALVLYGVEDATQAPGVIARRKATNLERYGAENPFAREASTFQAVQDALDGKRPVLKGADNPFAREDVKAKIRDVMTERYGVVNPQQAPEVRAKTQATNQERYGGELRGSPVLRARIDATNVERYGDTEPSRNPAVIETIRQTNLARYGVEWTNQDPDVRRRQLETMFAHYGNQHYFASDEGKREVRAVMMERYGVEFASQMEGFWEKAVATFQEHYGVDHPLQLEEFLDKRMATCREVYGVDSPLQNPEILAKLVETNQERYGVDYPTQNPDVMAKVGVTNRERYGVSAYLASDQHKQLNIAKYGVDHPMKNRDYARKHLERMGTNMNPTLPERLVASYAPVLVYTGDRKFWRWLPLLNKHKNPDFIVPGSDPAHPKRGVTKVVEVFGDFWHSRMFTGKAPFDHEQELIDAYRDVGLDCLIIWESEVKGDAEGTRAKLAGFCGA